MQFIGTVESVIFRNAENGYTVISLYSEGKKETAVGIFPPVSEGEEVIIEGKRVVNGRFGEQIAAESVRTKPPSTPEGIVKYLSSDLFKGIGEITARRIVDKFGEKTFDIIANDPGRLDDVKGINAEKAMMIGETFNELKGMQDAIIFLQQYDISLNLAIKIFRQYKMSTEAILTSNPYKMIYDIDGVGYFTADRIAVKMGLPKESPARIQAAINYVLINEANKSGHTYLPINELAETAVKLLAYDESKSALITSEIENLADFNYVVTFEKDGFPSVMLKKFYEMEKDIAVKLAAIVRDFGVPELKGSIRGDIGLFEEMNGITLHTSQKEAVETAVKCGGTVITGGPGTGKTTIIKCILAIMRSRGLEIALCAPTGRAAKRLSEATGENAMTIHRMLDLDYKDGKGYFTFNENTRLTADAVIVDEVSMADEYVFKALVTAVKKGAGLIIVGDKDQLPSVGAGNVLADVIKSGIFKVKELTEIYRQGSESYIISNAHRINKGLMPELDVKSGDFFFIETSGPQETAQQVTALASARLPQYLKVNAEKIQVLCPMKKGQAGVNNINIELQKRLNPEGAAEMTSGDFKYRPGDKVIQLANNYQTVWTKDDGETGEGIFNGDIGFVESVDPENMEMSVRFDDDKIVLYKAGDFDELAPAYAITVHKSQGSEFDAVIIALSPGGGTILTRNLLYTAVTRAKKLAVIVGDRKTVAYMVDNNYTAMRYTCLVDFIKEEMKRE